MDVKRNSVLNIQKINVALEYGAGSASIGAHKDLDEHVVCLKILECDITAVASSATQSP